uniref:Uncharacterized protein n=1 Tax=Plectus sambesii TaxID=2011161 RepID=A0A914VIY2_9BILA
MFLSLTKRMRKIPSPIRVDTDSRPSSIVARGVGGGRWARRGVIGGRTDTPDGKNASGRDRARGEICAPNSTVRSSFGDAIPVRRLASPHHRLVQINKATSASPEWATSPPLNLCANCARARHRPTAFGTPFSLSLYSGT